jgi:hypothetical protein
VFAVRTGRELPGSYSYLGYDLMGSKRKGREQLYERKSAMFDGWAERLNPASRRP